MNNTTVPAARFGGSLGPVFVLTTQHARVWANRSARLDLGREWAGSLSGSLGIRRATWRHEWAQLGNGGVPGAGA